VPQQRSIWDDVDELLTATPDPSTPAPAKASVWDDADELLASTPFAPANTAVSGTPDLSDLTAFERDTVEQTRNQRAPLPVGPAAPPSPVRQPVAANGVTDPASVRVTEPAVVPPVVAPPVAPPVRLGSAKTGGMATSTPGTFPILDAPAEGVKQIKGALPVLAKAATSPLPLEPPDQRVNRGRFTGLLGKPTPPMQPQTKAAVTDVLGGGMKVAEPLMAAGAAMAPVSTAAAIAAASGAGMATEKGVQALGGSPEDAQLMRAVVETAVGAYAGKKVHEGISEGGRAARAATEAGRAPGLAGDTGPVPVGAGRTEAAAAAKAPGDVWSQVDQVLDTLPGQASPGGVLDSPVTVAKTGGPAENPNVSPRTEPGPVDVAGRNLGGFAGPERRAANQGPPAGTEERRLLPRDQVLKDVRENPEIVRQADEMKAKADAAKHPDVWSQADQVLAEPPAAPAAESQVPTPAETRAMADRLEAAGQKLAAADYRRLADEREAKEQRAEVSQASPVSAPPAPETPAAAGDAARAGAPVPEPPVPVDPRPTDTQEPYGADGGGGKVFLQRFNQTGHRAVGGGPKTTPADETTWVGTVEDLAPATIRIRPRPITEGEGFLTPGNARLRSSKVGQGGHFLDVEIVRGELTLEQRNKLHDMVAEADSQGRPVRVRKAGEPFRSGNVGGQAETGRESAPAAANQGVTYFRSGASRPADFKGFADARVPVGVTATELSGPVRTHVVTYLNDGGQVFVDSGAFAALKGKAVDFDKVVAHYEALAAATTNKGGLHVVAPDVIGNDAQTALVQARYADRLRALVDAGVNVVVPVQKGRNTLATSIRNAQRLVPGATIGIPSNAEAFAPRDVATALRELGDQRPAAVHLLGLGEQNPGFDAAVAAIRAAAPGIQISSDSNRLASMFSKGRPDQVEAKRRTGERVENKVDTQHDVDTTELWGELGRGALDAFSAGELERLAKTVGATVPELRRSAAKSEEHWKGFIELWELSLDQTIAEIARNRAQRQEGPKVRSEVITEREKKGKLPVQDKPDPRNAIAKALRGADGPTLFEEITGKKPGGFTPFQLAATLERGGSKYADKALEVGRRLLGDKLPSNIVVGKTRYEVHPTGEVMKWQAVGKSGQRWASDGRVTAGEYIPPAVRAELERRGLPVPGSETPAGSETVITSTPSAGEPAVGARVRTADGREGIVREVLTAGKAGGKGDHRLRRRARVQFETTAKEAARKAKRADTGDPIAPNVGDKYEQHVDLDKLVTLEASDESTHPSGPAPSGTDAHERGETPEGSGAPGARGSGDQDRETDSPVPTEAETLDSLVQQAVGAGWKGDPQTLRAELASRLELVRELDEQLAGTGRDPRVLLRAVSDRGGISLQRETGWKGEIRWLQEHFAGMRGGTGKRLAFGTVWLAGDKKPYQIFHNGGNTLDQLLGSLQADGRFGHLETLDDLFEELRAAASLDKASGALLDRFRDSLGPEWWTKLPQTLAPEPVDDAVAPADDADISFDPAELERNTSAAAEEIRRLMGINREQITAYDPDQAVQKVGGRWSYTTTNGTDHKGLYDTRREALEAAKRHQALQLEMDDDPESFYDVTSLRAGEDLKKIKAYMDEGLSEMQAGARVRAERETAPAADKREEFERATDAANPRMAQRMFEADYRAMLKLSDAQKAADKKATDAARGSLALDDYERGMMVEGFNSVGEVQTTGPLGVRVKFITGRMLTTQGARGYFDMDPKDLAPLRSGAVEEEPAAAPAVDKLDTGELQSRLPVADKARQVGKADTSFRAPQQASGNDFNLTAENEPEEEDTTGTLFLPVRDKGQGAVRSVGPVDKGSAHPVPNNQTPMLSPRKPSVLERLGIKPKRKALPVAEIQKKLVELFQVPVGIRHFPQRAYGIYKPNVSAVRLGTEEDLQVLAHEFGHHLDIAIMEGSRQFVRGPIAAELKKVGAATSLPSYSAKQKRMEGTAEFFRLWLTAPATAQAEAPLYYAAFQKFLDTASPKLVNGLYEIRDDVQRYVGLSAGDQARLHVDFTGGSSTVLAQAKKIAAAAKTPEARARTMAYLSSQWMDDLAFLQLAEASMHNDEPLDVGLSAYVQARLARGYAAKAEGFLTYGVRDHSGQFLGRSLDDALAPVYDRLDEFAVYAAAKRAEDLEKRGKSSGFTVEQRRAILEQYDGDEAFQRALAGVNEFNKAKREYMRRGGILSDEHVARMNKLEPNYVPFQRVMDAADAFFSGRKLANRASPIKRIKGSGRRIVNPLESMIRNTHAEVSATETNLAMLKLVKQLAGDKGQGLPGSAQWLEEIPEPKVMTTVQPAEDLENEIRRRAEGDGRRAAGRRH
jgi:hypothetical protein